MLLIKNIKITLIITIAIFSGCSAIIDDSRKWTEEQFYTEAKEEMDNGNYSAAIEYYEMLEARYPFGRFSKQAQLDSIYAYYKNDEPESAILAADRFIKNHPRHPNVDYIYYLRGLVFFGLNDGLFDRFFPIDHTQRDSVANLRSFQNFSKLVFRFPHSKYAEDARQRMLFLRNKLAQHEIHVAQYYIKRSAYIAAANRAKYVVETYPRTPAIPEALVILAKSYKILGMKDLFTDTLKILKLNYPNHKGIAEVENLAIL